MTSAARRTTSPQLIRSLGEAPGPRRTAITLAPEAAPRTRAEAGAQESVRVGGERRERGERAGAGDRVDLAGGVVARHLTRRSVSSKG